MIPSARRHLRTEGVRLCNFCIDSSSTPKTSSRSWGETRKHAHSSRPCWRPFSRGLGRRELEHTDDGSQVGATWQGRYLKQSVAKHGTAGTRVRVLDRLYGWRVCVFERQGQGKVNVSTTWVW